MGYLIARGLAEVERVLRERAGEVLVLAGATDLMVRARRAVRERAVLDVAGVAELRTIAVEGEELVLGAAVTLAECLTDSTVRRAAPLLARVAERFASPQVRHVATVGGNVANASPAGDAVAALWALDAMVEAITPRDGRVRRPLSEVVVGPGRLSLPPGSVITGFRVPARGRGEGSAFSKLVNRAWPEHPMAISVASAAVRLRLDGEGRVGLARIVLGAVAPTPVRALAAEALLTGSTPTSDRVAEAGEAAAGSAAPVSDLRASAAYRKEVVTGLVVRALERSLAGARSDGWGDRG